MKKILSTIVFLLLAVAAFAQSEVLTLYRKDGIKVQYSFIDKPVIYHHGENLVVKTDAIEVVYPFGDVVKYTINESKEEVNLKKVVIDNDNLTEYINETDIDDCDITYIRTFADTLWQSLYVPFDIEPAKFADDFEFALINNFHQYDDNNDGVFDRIELEVKRCDLTKILQANYPYLIRAKECGTKSMEIGNTTLYATEDFSIDCSSVEFLYTFTGGYKTIKDLRKKGCYYLDGGYLTKAYKSSQELEPFRWTMSIMARNSQYKDSPIIVGSQKIKVCVYGEDGATGIEETECALTTPVEIYDLNGVRHTSTDKSGLYIMKMKDGSYKKVFIK